jgi:hypothetical protein
MFYTKKGFLTVVLLLNLTIVYCQNKPESKRKFSVFLSSEYRIPNNLDSYLLLWDDLTPADISFERNWDKFDYFGSTLRFEYDFFMSNHISMGIFLQKHRYATTAGHYYETDDWYNSTKFEDRAELEHTLKFKPFVIGPNFKVHLPTKSGEYIFSYTYGFYNLLGSSYTFKYRNELTSVYGNKFLLWAGAYKNTIIKYSGFGDVHKVELGYTYNMFKDNSWFIDLKGGYQRMVVKNIKYKVKHYDTKYLGDARDFFGIYFSDWKEYNEGDKGILEIENERFSLDLGGFYFIFGLGLEFGNNGE